MSVMHLHECMLTSKVGHLNGSNGGISVHPV